MWGGLSGRVNNIRAAVGSIWKTVIHFRPEYLCYDEHELQNVSLLLPDLLGTCNPVFVMISFTVFAHRYLIAVFVQCALFWS